MEIPKGQELVDFNYYMLIAPPMPERLREELIKIFTMNNPGVSLEEAFQFIARGEVRWREDFAIEMVKSQRKRA